MCFSPAFPETGLLSCPTRPIPIQYELYHDYNIFYLTKKVAFTSKGQGDHSCSGRLIHASILSYNATCASWPRCPHNSMDKLNNQDNESGFQRSRSSSINHTQNKDEIEQWTRHTRTVVLHSISEAAQKLSPWHVIRVGTILCVRMGYGYGLGQCFPDNQLRII